MGEKRLTGVNSLILSGDSVAGNVEEVPHLVQLTTGATKVDRSTIVQVAQGSLNVAESVRLASTGADASIGERLGKELKKKG